MSFARRSRLPAWGGAPCDDVNADIESLPEARARRLLTAVSAMVVSLVVLLVLGLAIIGALSTIFGVHPGTPSTSGASPTSHASISRAAG